MIQKMWLLDEEVIDFINHPHIVEWDNNAYMYLWGMDKVTDDVYATGVDIMRQVIAADEKYYKDGEYKDEFLKAYETILKLDSDNFCSFFDSDCFEKIGERLDVILSKTEEVEMITRRYQKFFTYDHFSRGKPMTIESPFPQYHWLTSGQKTLHYQLLIELRSGNKAKSIDILHSQNLLIREKLSQVDDLIAKMVLTDMLTELVEFTNLSHGKGWLTGSEIEKTGITSGLTKQEMSVYKPMFMEYQSMIHMMNKYFPVVMLEMDKELPFIFKLFIPDLIKAMVKPKLLINVQFQQQIKPNLEYHKKDVREFYDGYDKIDISVEHDLRRNALGEVFNITAEENKERYMSYQIRLYDLDMKIQLLRSIITEGSVAQLLNAVEKEPMKYPNSYDFSAPYKEGDKICYSGLVEENEKNRCLIIH